MKKNLLLLSLLPLFVTTGCIVRDGGWHHRHYDDRPAVIVGPPAVEVRPPEVIVR